MKFSQIAAVIVTLLISTGVVMWLANSVPTAVFDGAEGPVAKNDPSEAVPPPVEEGVHHQNPFHFTTEGPQPKAVLPDDLYNFGTMALGLTGSHDFIIRNEGVVPLQLAKGPVQCKCTVNGLNEETIPPGAEAQIHLEWTPKSLGEFGQGALIWTNDPENSELNIRVEGNLVPEVQMSPENGWILGSIPSGKPVSLQGEISTGLYDTFEITSVETSSDKITVTTEALSDRELLSRNAKVGFLIHAEYLPPEESGTFRETIKIQTTLEKRAEFVFPITGSRSGPIVIVGTGWTAGNRSLDLGRIDAEKGKTQRLTFMVEASDPPLEVTDITVTPEFAQATLTAEKNAEDAKRHRYTFLVTIPPNSPKGIWSMGEPGTVTIKTNHPKLGEIPVHLVMTIQ